MFRSGDPLSKKKDQLDKFPKEKIKISVATAKKILKSTKRVIGNREAVWLNFYIENRVQGECLPRAFLSNDLPSEIIKAYGVLGADRFNNEIITAFNRELTYERTDPPPYTADSASPHKSTVPSS